MSTVYDLNTEYEPVAKRGWAKSAAKGSVLQTENGASEEPFWFLFFDTVRQVGLQCLNGLLFKRYPPGIPLDVMYIIVWYATDSRITNTLKTRKMLVVT